MSLGMELCQSPIQTTVHGFSSQGFLSGRATAEAQRWALISMVLSQVAADTNSSCGITRVNKIGKILSLVLKATLATSGLAGLALLSCKPSLHSSKEQVVKASQH